MGYFDSLRNLFSGKKKPTAPKLGPGHRGIAAGSIAKPNLDSYTERLARGHDAIPVDEVQGFLEGLTPLFVHSSNLAMLQFYPEDNKLQVEFKNGSAYLYSNVSESDAIAFANAQSKGSHLWDFYRVRGSKTAHRRPFVKIK